MEFVGRLAGSSQTDKKIQNQLWNRWNPGSSEGPLSRNYSVLVSIYLRLKVLRKTMSLICLPKSDTCPLARGKQGTLIDMPSKIIGNDKELMTPEGIEVQLPVVGWMNDRMLKDKYTLATVSQGSPHFHFTNKFYFFSSELSIGQHCLYWFIYFPKKILLARGIRNLWDALFLTEWDFPQVYE